ncbi:MAG: protein phosphatase [Sulfurospirillum sp.]|nr:MAG: protein phosphatase [Sulfurospirillum sp.]
MSQRVIVYGDIHGCLKEFKKLREKIKPTKNDIEISTGDFINKGFHSIKVLRYIEKNNILSVRGNNEDKIVKGYEKYKKEGKKAISNLRADEIALIKEISKRDYHYLKSLPFYLKINNLTVVHAGIPLGVKLKKNMSEKDKKSLTLLRFYNKDLVPIPYRDKENRYKFWSELYDGREGFVVFGHHPFPKPKIDKYAIGIDTGCVYGGKLSAVVFKMKNEKVDTKKYKIYQEKSSKNYWHIVCSR